VLAGHRPQGAGGETVTDDELKEAMADLWVNNGGDDTGFWFCVQSILERIKFKLEQRAALEVKP